MRIEKRLAHPALRGWLRGFGQRRAEMGGGGVTIRTAARPNQLVEFYFAEPYRIRWDGHNASVSPRTVVVGPQSRPGLSLMLSGTVEVFTVHLHPTALHRLAGVRLPEIVDEGVDMVDLLGGAGARLRDAVSLAGTFETRATAAERWVADLAERAGSVGAIDRAAGLLVRTRGAAPIGTLAARSGLSVSQFERRFREAVGFSPKFYARTVRLAHALDLQGRRPELGWAEIAAAAGYSDQSHLTRDCTALAGAPPARFARADFVQDPR